ncbi:DUF3710 domain-containing protein [Plantactinospora sonchi]|uniref:DUF3710 domain-containing protein n=1 Tax=Plantactinospora sonchi TaxID=1544735 RepID=A0ABU7S2J4_9ACTN
MIFSRGRGGGRHARDERSDQPTADTQDIPAETGVDRRRGGPYDSAEDFPDLPRLDLGSLQIPAVPDVEVRVQANPDGVIQQVVLVHGESALQLGVFAAPRSEGIWDEWREEIRTSLAADGVVAEENEGDYGTELRARVRTPDGGVADLRFVGVDGPRWMVQGVFQGRAASDPEAARALTGCLDGLVVDRGKEAKPVREPLPLRLPREPGNAADGTAEAAAPVPDGAVNGTVSGRQTPRRGNSA